MIFNSDTYGSGSSTISKYPVGLEGALMHVYENECNYNALMKAAGISELRYYQETGKDLFVHEAGAFSGFIEKAKAFFKKVIEKIKAIFHKFAAVINQYSMGDKEFVKKYEKELYRKNLTDFEFNGYKFSTGRMIGSDVISAVDKVLDVEAIFDQIKANGKLEGYGKIDLDDMKPEDIDEAIERYRGAFISDSGTRLSESEFRDEFKDKVYGGDKETLDKIDIRQQLKFITDTKTDIKNAENLQKVINKKFEGIIKKLEELGKEYRTITDAERNNASESEHRSAVTKRINNAISVCEKAANVSTTFYGMVVQFFKDRNRQAKAICVKAIGYNKKESYSYSESSVDDLFAGVTIR